MIKKEVKSSGKQQHFDTGSKRDDESHKIKPDLFPAFVKMLLGKHYAEGGKHYGDRNWEKGQPITRYIRSAERHWLAWQCGITDEPHLIATIWNLIAICFTLYMIKIGYLPKELDDRPIHMQDDNEIGKIMYEELIKK